MFEFIIKPRFSETDALGHINNTVVPVWFEEARIGVFEIFNPGLSISTWNLILKKFEIEFFHQIMPYQDILITTTISKLGNTSLTVHQTATQSGKVVVSGNTVLVHFDYKTQKSAAIPSDIREKLTQHVVDVSQ
ncbi:MAG: acyl-CoA thioesterase [SAR324 cluster bacterium]|nr:acyl-CoA thioesterase [SAR324 cluster bacterium]